MAKGKYKTKYIPLVELLDDEHPTVERITDVFKRAAKKNVSLDTAEFIEKFGRLINSRELSKDQLKKVYKTLKSCSVSLSDRGKDKIAQDYTVLSTYIFHYSV